MHTPSLRELGATSRIASSVAAARCAGIACRLLRRGGTSFPGLVALRLAPGLVGSLAAGLGGGTLLVAGTNGKTTTAALAAAALRGSGHHVLHNQAGSNMMRGLAATLAGKADARGRIRGHQALTGLFEVDEAALPAVLGQVRPRVLAITNLFRDQLDRYGELQAIADLWREAIQQLPPTTVLVLNADDPLVCWLGRAAPGAVLYYGVQGWGDSATPEPMLARSADSLFCPNCGEVLQFTAVAYAHLGRYRCRACGYARPDPDLQAAVYPRQDGHAIRFQYGTSSSLCTLRLPGRYNVYNAVAAVALALAAGLELQPASEAVAAAKGAFGRAESMKVKGRTVRLYLIKNPTGADEVFRVLAAGDTSAPLALLLNDKAADGHDISWIWDANWELLQGWRGPVRCGGSRAEDMALRLKYAGLPGPYAVDAGAIGTAIATALEATSEGGMLFIVATYTAMLEAHRVLARLGHLMQFWETSA